MVIGVNGRFLNKPFTGIHNYTVNLLREIAKLKPDWHFLVTVTEEVEIDLGKNVQLKVLPERRLGSAGMKKTWWEQLTVPDFFKSLGVDRAFFPYPANPWYHGLGIKTVVAVHDAIPWKRGPYSKRLMSRMYHSQTKRAVKKADKVITVSKFSKEEVVKICRVPEEKVKVIYNGVSEVFAKGKGDAGILDELGLKEKKFFLYAGGYDERKNVMELVKEFLKFGEPDVYLVLVGGKLLESDLYKSFDELGDGERIIKAGFVADEELVSLYKHCLAFVHLSKEEGFNLPVIEAASCGAPLILSDIPVHKEVAGNAALYMNDGVFGKVMDTSVRAKLKKQSLELAKKYSWKKAAQETLDVLNSL